MTDAKYILAMLPLQHHYAREVAAGLRRYERHRANWRVRISGVSSRSLQHTLEDCPPGQIGGLVAFAASDSFTEELLATGMPVVNVSGRLPPGSLPTVVSDNRRIGELAAEHLLDRRFQRFAYLGKPDLHFSHERGAGFRKRIEAAGGSVRQFMTGPMQPVFEWLSESEEPTGVMTCFDGLAREFVEACHDRDIAVPDDVAVVGADDNEFNCQQGRVLITSVPTEGRRVGFFAAELLDRLMAGAAPPTDPIRVAPVAVVPRESTEVIAATDPVVADALRHIYLHACDPINVAQLSEQTGIPRRTMEKHFRAGLGRTPHEEIRRVQFERARQLLAETDLKIAEVARRSGFTRANYFMTEFKRHFRQTPTEFREDVRENAGDAHRRES